jgi:fatty acid desaturase
MTAPARGEEFRDDYRKALPKETVERLAKISFVRSSWSVLQEAILLASLVVIALVFWHSPLAVAVCVVLIGTRQHALFVLAHDAAHYRLFEQRWLNDLAGRACATVQGLSMRTYRVVHRLHHNNLYGPADPDTALHGGYPRGRMYLAKKLLKDLTGFTAWKTYAYFFGAPAINTETNVALRPLNDTSERLRGEARRDRAAVIGFHLAALALAAATGCIIEYLVLWILPLVTVVQAILRLRAIAEHGATTDFSSPLTAARTNLASPLVEWLIFPHSVNYHIEHHLYASVPHYNLPELHREMVRHGVLEGAEVLRFGQTLGKIFAPRRVTA